MPIRPTYQQVILPSTLYEVKRSAPMSGSEQITPSIEVVGGAGVSIYGSQQQPSAAPAAMFLTRSGFTGIEAFGVIPNYLYITGAATTITLSGVTATPVV